MYEISLSQVLTQTDRLKTFILANIEKPSGDTGEYQLLSSGHILSHGITCGDHHQRIFIPITLNLASRGFDIVKLLLKIPHPHTLFTKILTGMAFNFLYR